MDGIAGAHFRNKHGVCDAFWARARKRGKSARKKAGAPGSTNLRRINLACVRNFLQRDLTPRDPRDLTLERDIRVPGNGSATG